MSDLVGPVGLTMEEVNERVEQGLVNLTDITTDKSVWKIIQTNTLTYFNLIFLIITVLLCVVGSYRNLTFLPIIIINTGAGIVQELRAKRTLDKMNMLNAPHSIVVRDGVQSQILSQELVKDDCVLLRAGNQICADGVVIQGSISVNEALLTGEADEIKKETGSKLLSGSFVVSGQCYAKMECVGKESYISKLTAEAKAMGEGEQSGMLRSLNQLVKWVGIIIIPVAAILFAQAYYVNKESFGVSIVSMIAAIIGMIPEGLYLLTTISLALSTLKLAQVKVLLHGMKSIETLARVDVLCVDKTGTITEPDMKVVRILPGGNAQESEEEIHELENLLADYAAAVQDDNSTMEAIRAYIADSSAGQREKKRKPESVIPFSSSRKYSMVSFGDGNYVLGAPEFVMGERYELISEEIAPYLQKGYRVLMIGKSQQQEHLAAEEITPLGYVILANPIRKNAKETFDYFRSQGVTVKVISGDHPASVSEIAKQAGIENAEQYIDVSTLLTDEEVEDASGKYTVFGRVTPSQKQTLVKALQKSGHTVAMTGDGVNDILAMKDADCSVAMASGSEAAAQAAQVVLLDSDFAHMPDVVLEGRRVVNNIQRSASLFLVKNIFSFLLALFSVFSAMTYPLEPSQVSLIGMFTIGIPGFLLALEPNKNRIEGNFMKNVLLKAFPAGLTDVIAVGALVVCGKAFALPKSDIATAATMLLAIVGFMILGKISKPFNSMKYGILAINIVGLLFCGVFLGNLFAISEMSPIVILIMIVFAFAAESLFRYLTLMTEKIRKVYSERKAWRDFIIYKIWNV
ncbi:MAG: cation-translocating P-type ATPase [Lachnospiraceae bacterium]|nr:cation-translocating P-type ATPase [Lachnospiraceae bacterium]